MAHARPKHLKEYHLAMLPQLIRCGWQMQEIAEEFGLSNGQVSKDWQLCVERFNQARNMDTASVRNLALARYEMLLKDTMQTYAQSAEEPIVTTIEEAEPIRDCVACEATGTNTKGEPCRLCKGTGKRGGVTKVTTKIEQRLPDRGCLHLAVDITDRIVELEGGKPSKKVDATVRVMPWDELTGKLPLVVEDDVGKSLAEIEAQVAKLSGHEAANMRLPSKNGGGH